MNLYHFTWNVPLLCSRTGLLNAPLWKKQQECTKLTHQGDNYSKLLSPIHKFPVYRSFNFYKKKHLKYDLSLHGLK